MLLLNQRYQLYITFSICSYNHVMFNDSREPLIEVAIQLLIVVLDYDMEQQQMLENLNNVDQSFEVI